MDNKNLVYVSDKPGNKDISDAKRFGTLKGVFTNTRKPYDANALIEQAHKSLKNFSDNDYLLMIGDPTLSALCMTVASEYCDRILTLSWDRLDFNYKETEWNF